MYEHNVPKRLARALAPRFAAGVVVTLALLSAACSKDSASRITAPSLSASMDRGSGSNSGSSGAASNFAVLAHTAVSCSGGSITGNVGTNQSLLETPPGAVTQTTGCLINGTIDIGGPAAKAAFLAFQNTYVALKPPVDCPLITGTLANTTLTPGTYCVSSEEKTGTLTLTGPANGTWIIKVPVGYLTGTNFHVVMAGHAQACNVTWWVQTYATMTTSAFQGNILAGAAISMTGGTFNGNAWAGASGVGDVTFTEGTVVTGCAGTNGNDNDKGKDKDKEKCNQGVGNGPEGCDPGKSNHGDNNNSNDENGGTRGDPGRQGGHH